MADWITLEKLVQLIEKSLEPGAKVEHNVMLPVLTSSSGHKRQCDVVITSGPEHRRTMSIVEVQDRDSQVDINTFGGWLEKVKEVGAQHLICVSRQEFPSSIKEKSAQLGGTVKLIRLKELSTDEIPLHLFRVNFSYEQFLLTEIRTEMAYQRSEAEQAGVLEEMRKVTQLTELSIYLPNFSWNKLHLITLYLICRDSLPPDLESGSGQNTIDISLAEAKKPIFYRVKNQFVQIGLKCIFSWDCIVDSREVPMLSYEEQENGTLAWVADIKYDSPAGPIWAKMPVIRSDHGPKLGAILCEFPKDVRMTLIQQRPV